MRLFSQDTKVQALKGVPLFAALSSKELVQLERVCEDLEVEPGRVLCKEGEIGLEFFVLVDARSRSSGRPAGGDDGRRRLFVLTSREFHAVLDRNPKVERKVLRALARRLVETSSDPTLA